MPQDDGEYSDFGGSDAAKSSSSMAESDLEVLSAPGSDTDASSFYAEDEAAELQERYLAASDSEDDDFTGAPATAIGNVPLQWYDDMPHIGYDVDGKRVLKPATKDELDAFLAKMDDPKYWSTFRDKIGQQDVTLSSGEMDILQRLQSGQFPDEQVDPHAPWVDFFTQDVERQPLTAVPEPKRRFIPSKWEHKRVMKIVRAIRAGLIVPAPAVSKQQREEAARTRQHYSLWSDEQDKERQPHPMHIPAPKMRLPDTSESVNPPAEYLPTEEERQQWLAMDPEDRPRNYLPEKFDSLRAVPGYSRFINERFARCLDLYLCPRVMKKRQVDPESLLPSLPDPKDLEPFPKQLAVEYRGHSGRVTSCAVDHSGQWMASAGEDGELRLWEVSSGRLVKLWKLDDECVSVAWNPSRDISLLVVATGKLVHLIVPPLQCSDAIMNATESMFATADFTPAKDTKSSVKWTKPTEEQLAQGFRATIQHVHTVNSVTWHRKGDYFASVCTNGGADAVQIHQLTTQQTQSPFNKSKGLVQRVLFHPSKPFLFVATQRYVRIYNLVRQELHKCLQPGAKWISSLDIHPQGDNVIVGTYDKKVCWFDMDLSVKPYKTLRYHDFAVRHVTYHRRQPLFASCSDDGNIHIFHGMVYSDLMQNPLIVPVKILKCQERVGGLGTLWCEFHPHQPWLFSCGSDNIVKLFT